ncbi:hypothetical protein ACQ86B_23620 [Mycolicibacterium aichiense]|uniref:hypothetical protein n=1 Tax=Mycolicibacterium aichiense TaxID=1799 RepID=UPI003D6652DC
MSENVSKASASTLLTISALETRAWIAKLLCGAAVGIVIGAIIGGLFFNTLRSEQSAMAFIRITPPADFAALAGSANQSTPDTSDNPAQYVAGEVSYLSGEGFARTVGQKLGKTKPAEYTVSQESKSTVVSIGSSAPSADEAVRTVQLVIDLYGQQLAQRTDQQMRLVLPLLDQWEQSDATNPQRVGDIQRLRENIRVQAASASTLEVLQPPMLDAVSALRWAIGLLLGAFCGGAGAVLYLMARRRRAGRGSVVMTIAEAVDDVLVPAVDLRTSSSGRQDGEQAALARSLYAQCPSAHPRRIAVVGVSSSSGSDTVASLLEFAAAERGPVTRISAANSAEPTLPRTDDDTTLIIDTGALGLSALTPEAIRQATDVVVVARVDADTVIPAMAACSAAAAGDAPVLALFTHRSWQWQQWATRKGRAASHSRNRNADTEPLGGDRHPV